MQPGDLVKIIKTIGQPVNIHGGVGSLGTIIDVTDDLRAPPVGYQVMLSDGSIEDYYVHELEVISESR